MTMINIYLATDPIAPIRNFLQMAHLEREFLFYYLLPLVIANSLLTLIWEKVFVKFISRKVKQCRRRRLNQKKLNEAGRHSVSYDANKIQSETYIG